MLLELMKSLGGGLICPKDVMLSGEKISSTRVKTLLKEGRVKEAGELLGRAYSVKKQIRHGLGLGKSFGFPTVNTDICESDPALAFGVYKCLTKIDGVTYNSLTNVGTCPTVGKREGHRETFIVGFDGDLYGKEIEIYFLDFVRGEKRFESVEELIMQIKDDIKTCFESEE
jgi:riboflavin kinase/FMN adenylyltransferase